MNTDPRPDILVVDDDPDIRDTLLDVLTSEGYVVASAENGREALHVAQKERPGLILLDMMMPVMDGWEFRDEQRRRPELASIPVIVVSASATCHADAVSMGAAACMQKPLDLEELLVALTRLCRPR
jgi:CheY-like chemotaxis protein